MDSLLNQAQLHKYQLYCVDFIKTHAITALFLDCGLGKTIITLTAINDLILDELKVSLRAKLNGSKLLNAKGFVAELEYALKELIRN